MNGFFKIIQRLLSVFSAIILAGCVVIIGLYIYGIRPYIVKTGSMEPTIEEGSICFVNERCPFENVVEGDIIAFSANSLTITHRVVKITDNGIITKGDANNTEDTNPVTIDSFIGKNVFVIKKAGYFASAMRSKRGVIVVIVIAVIYALLSLVEHYYQKKKPPMD